jgi:hypothetical protein
MHTCLESLPIDIIQFSEWWLHVWYWWLLDLIVRDVMWCGMWWGKWVGGKGPFGLSSQGDGAMPRTTRRASTSRALPPFFKNRFNQVPSVTEYPLIKRIRTDTTIDLSKILPRRVTRWRRSHFETNQSSLPLCTPDLWCAIIENTLIIALSHAHMFRITPNRHYSVQWMMIACMILVIDWFDCAWCDVGWDGMRCDGIG